MKISVIGAGKWGMALFKVLSQNNDCVINSRTKRNIPNFVDINQALESDLLVIAISAQHTRSWLEQNFKYSNQKILVASKGIENDSSKFLHEIYENYIDRDNLAFLSGPSFAKEVLEFMPCALVISSLNLNLANELSGIFPKFIKTYVSDDVIGAQICGAYKNVIAIACGICDGLGFGNNARASLISRGLVEMARFGKNFGAKYETFLGLSGAGDLFLTASSVLSRNYRVGLGLSKRQKLDNILLDLGEVAEGIASAKAIYKISENNKIYCPIVTEVYKIINGFDPSLSVASLISKNA